LPDTNSFNNHHNRIGSIYDTNHCHDHYGSIYFNNHQDRIGFLHVFYHCYDHIASIYAINHCHEHIGSIHVSNHCHDHIASIYVNDFEHHYNIKQIIEPNVITDTNVDLDERKIKFTDNKINDIDGKIYVADQFTYSVDT